MELTDKVLRIRALLLEEYGNPPWVAHDPVDTLVNTILSQNTSDTNRDRAYAQLRQRFPTWEAVRDAPTGAVQEAIRPAGLADTKAPRIQAALRTIAEERGELSLDFLRDMPLPEARAWLTSMHGVGPKTAAIVLLFAMQRPAFPVDTHVHRVTKRLGLIPPRASREAAHELLEAIVPPDLYYDLHINLINLGRQVCRPTNPAHDRCVVRDLCDTFRSLAP
ncbi:MAG: endonuclease III [Anaerolineales bacterium]|nr:endonuclease III [Anaerolineales bacterium]